MQREIDFQEMEQHFLSETLITNSFEQWCELAKLKQLKRIADSLEILKHKIEDFK